MEEKRDTKQEKLENKIDDYSGYPMGEEMIAMIALNARHTVQGWKANRFIQEFSESLGFKKHIDTAVRVINYLYPQNNHTAWKMWDEIYLKKVKKSAWLQYNFKNN